MSFNPFKPLVHNIQKLFLNKISIKKQRDYDDLECLQFGICAVEVQSPRSEELFFR